MTKNSTLKFFINTYLSEVEQFSTDSLSEQPSVSDFAEAKVSDRCLENVLNFARAYRVINTKQAGAAEIILN